MIERYCDVCLRRMGQPDTQPTAKYEPWVGEGIDKRRVAIEVKITRSVNGVWNDGDVCIPCIQRAVAEGEFALKTE